MKFFRCRVVALVLLTLLAACGEDSPAVDTSAGASGNTTSTVGASSATTTVADAGFSTTAVSTPAAQSGLLRAVRATADGGLERVEFEFEGALPGYRIDFASRPVTQDGSGEEVEVDGDAILLVHFEPASGFDLTGEGRKVYTGPERLDLATSTITEVVRVGDFEAVLQWAVGLDAKVPFRVRTATSPNRVILEVKPSAG